MTASDNYSQGNNKDLEKLISSVLIIAYPLLYCTIKKHLILIFFRNSSAGLREHCCFCIIEIG
jgi:hypothetical protein